MPTTLPILLTLLSLGQTPATPPADVPPTPAPERLEVPSTPRLVEPETESATLPELDEVAPTLEAPAAVKKAPSHPCVGKPIYSVRLSGCHGPVCDSSEMRVGFVTLTGIKPGQVLGEQAVARLLGRLEGTGFFRSVALTCTPKGEELALVIEVKPHRFVRRVSIKGNQFFRETELAKRVTVHSGDPLDVEPGQEADDEQPEGRQ